MRKLLVYCSLAIASVHAKAPTGGWKMPAETDRISLSWVNGPPVVQGWRPEDKHLSTFRDAHALLALRSGHWGMLLDPRQIKVERLSTGDARAVDADNKVLEAILAQWTPSRLDLHAAVDGKVYRPSGAPIDNKNPTTMPVRIVESGEFFQHIAIYDLELRDDSGALLDAVSRLEIRAWGDRCLFQWHVETAAGAPAELTASLDLPGSDEKQSATARDTMVRLGIHFAGGKLQPLGKSQAGIAISAKTLDDFTVREPSASYSPITDAWEIRIPKQQGWPLDQGPQDDIPLYLPELLDRISRFSLHLENNSAEAREVRLRLIHDYHPISGYVPMVLQADGTQTGLPLQSSKNWHVMPGIPLPYDNAWIHVTTLLRLEPGAKVDLRYDTVHARWHGVPASSAAQLSLIGWGFNGFWVQMALGSWGETLCVQPGRTQRRCFITDVRPFMMHGPSGLPYDWTPNFGGADIARIVGSDGKVLAWQNAVTNFRMIGPNLSHVQVTEQSEEGDLRLTIDSYLPRSNSSARSYFRVKLEALNDFVFNELALFQLGSDYYNEVKARTVTWGAQSGKSGSANPPEKPNKEWGQVMAPVRLPGEAPWVALHGVAGKEGVPISPVRSLIVRDYVAVLGGKEERIAQVAAARRGGGALNAELVLPADIKKLQKGDSVEFLVQMTLFPPTADSYYGPSEVLRNGLATTPDSWEMVAQEADCQSVSIDGQARLFPATITAPDDTRLEFTVKSRSEMDTVHVIGLPDPSLWEIGEILDGKFAALGQRFAVEAGPQLNYQPANQTWSLVLSLVFPEGASQRTFSLRPAGK